MRSPTLGVRRIGGGIQVIGKRGKSTLKRDYLSRPRWPACVLGVAVAFGRIITTNSTARSGVAGPLIGWCMSRGIASGAAGSLSRADRMRCIVAGAAGKRRIVNASE